MLKLNINLAGTGFWLKTLVIIMGPVLIAQS